MEEDPLGLCHPLLCPYAWLFDGPIPIAWESVKDQTVWNAAADRADYVGEHTEDGDQHWFEVLKVRVRGASGEAYRYTVYFASDCGYFPMKWASVSPNGKPAAAAEVVQMRRVARTANSSVLPLSHPHEPDRKRRRFVAVVE